MLNQVLACLLVLFLLMKLLLGVAGQCLEMPPRALDVLLSLAVAQDFGGSQKEFLASSQSAFQVSSTVHVLSMLLRLRQCCCHLSLLKVVITLHCSSCGVEGVI